MKRSLPLKTALLFNLILALSSTAFLILSLAVFQHDHTRYSYLPVRDFRLQVWNIFFIVKTIFFWLLTSIVPWAQVIYLRFGLNNQSRPPQERQCGWLLRPVPGRAVPTTSFFGGALPHSGPRSLLFAGNLAMALIVGLYGLAGLRTALSFTGAWWHTDVLQAIAIPGSIVLLALANLKILRPRPIGRPDRDEEKKNNADQ